MTAFIEVTTVTDMDIHIAVDKIVSFSVDKGNGYTNLITVEMNGDEEFRLEQTPSEILARIEATEP